jgi:long-chain acyl-CoA synthetase
MADTLIGIFVETCTKLRKPAQFMRKSAGGWESIPAERALADVESVGLGLRDLGVQKGDRVAILSENRYEWPILDLAIVGQGAVTVPIYPTLTSHQCAYILKDAEARIAVVSSPMQHQKLAAARSQLPSLESVIFLDAVAAPPGDRSFQTVLERGASLRAQDPQGFRRLSEAVKPQDLATIIYTSGTTGEPKGAMLTHHNIVSNVVACLGVVDLRPTDTCLSFLPLCHIFERMGGLYAMLGAGATIAYAESMETVAANALEVRPTVLLAVPRFYEKVYARVMEAGSAHPAPVRALFRWGLAAGARKARARFARSRPGPLLALQAALADRLVARKIRERVGGRLRFCISGSAPLSTQVIEFFFAIGIPIYEGYGLTETSPVITLNPPGRERPGAVGKPVAGVEVKIGAEGEILTRGPHVMMGYFRNEAATREAIRDGWFHTGDVGFVDPDGYLVITDRIKDLIVLAGGKKVAPQPLEGRLKQSRWIGEAVLLGDRKPYVVALLVPNFANLEAEARARGWTYADRGELLRRPEVLGLFQAEVDKLNADLAPFERVKKFELLQHELTQDAGELTPTLKVKRRVVMKKYGDTIDRLYPAQAAPAA